MTNETKLNRKEMTDGEMMRVGQWLRSAAEKITEENVDDQLGFSDGYHTIRQHIQPLAETAARVFEREDAFLAGATLALLRVLENSEEHLTRVTAVADFVYAKRGLPRPGICDVLDFCGDAEVKPVPKLQVRAAPKADRDFALDDVPF